MNYWQRLWRIELVGIAALVIFAIGVGIVFFVSDSFSEPAIANRVFSLRLGLFSTFIFGFIPVTLFGAPIYAGYIAHPAFDFRIMLFVSLLPGFVLLVAEAGLGVFGIAGGAFVFSVVHFGTKRWLSGAGSTVN